MRSAPNADAACGVRERIAPVDGLRALAVFGVIWAHVWMFSGNPALSLGKVGAITLDLNRAVSAIGTGVDLFFVISGFCMYLMYAKSQAVFSWRRYGAFIRKRWLRIAPAFYAAAVVCALGFVLSGRPFPAFDLLSHFAFAHILFHDTGALAAPFWSLATEWHFYLVLPLLVWGASRWGFWASFGAAAVACIAFRAWVYLLAPEAEGFVKVQLPHRLIEFVWGICVAKLYADGESPPRILCGAGGFLIAAAIAYAGRLLMVTEVVNAAGAYGAVLKVAAEPVLTAGYALMLWNLVSGTSVFQRFFSLPALQIVGRWSYSLYLWHWWPTVWIAGAMSSHFGSNALVQHVSLVICLAVLLPISWLSYRMFELPYFQTRSAIGPMPAAEARNEA